MFETIVGNDHIKAYLERMIETRSVGNSLLFAGPEGIGKSIFAKALAKALITADDPKGTHGPKVDSDNHPDIRHYRPEGKLGMHSIEAMRQFNDEVYLVPFEAKWKVFIIHDAHRMLPYSANALLKTFEEPAADSVIIMLSSAPELLLPTVLSRCRKLHFHRLSDKNVAKFLIEKHQCQPDHANYLASLSNGSFARAENLMTQGGDSMRQTLLEFLSKEKVSTYKELTGFIKDLCSKIENTKKETEEIAKEELLHGVAMENLSAQQKAGISKEVEGAISMRFIQDAYSLLDIILSWYRDLHLLYLAGDHNYLLNKDYESKIHEKIIHSEPPPLEGIQEAISEAKLSLARSTALTICLENLFLKLNFL